MERPIIEVKKLVRKFGELTAVNDVSFAVNRGEIFSFLGPNGAGKSTTIKILTTLLRPTAGEVRVNGFNAVSEQDNVRHSFGIVFQDPSLDDELTAWENMEFHGVLYGVPKDTRRKRIEELMNFVELWDRKDDLVKNFSGGMKRRLEIARGLLHHPRVLFFRRTNSRTRSANAQSYLELHPKPQQNRGDHNIFHHPLHGGGGTRIEQGCNHRPR